MEELVDQDRFPHIEYRSFRGERHACVKGRLQVWQIVFIAKGYDMDASKTASHLAMPVDQVQSALNFYAAYPNEIDHSLRENSAGYEHLKDRHPSLHLIDVPSIQEG